MTISEAKKQLAMCISLLNLEEDEFAIIKGHLVSKNGKIDFPVKKLITIIPAHGTVMAIWKREDI